MRWIKRGLTIFFIGLVPAVIAVMVISNVFEQAEIRKFYEGRPILNAMQQAVDGAKPGESSNSRAQSAFDARFPLGTARAEALQALAAEGIPCPLIRDSKVNGNVCGLDKPTMNSHRWHIELNFDPDDKLTRSRVLILK